LRPRRSRRGSDELARRRQELPWVRISKEYRFDTNEEGRNEARGPDDPLNFFRRHDEYHHANGAGK
jgi:predicted dithiol-disulfide oxidoreductase (DUF899 family)